MLPLALALLCLVAPNALASPSAETPDFQREVRPLLADRCFRCHGPDAEARKAGLRLDTAEGAQALLKSGARAVVPGNSSESELVARISATHESERMPPEELGRPLSAAEQDVLRRWVESGGAYSPHWAFVAPRKQAPPPVKALAWCRDELDRYVLAELEARGLSPQPEAEAATLARRISLVLTGLAPAPTEIADLNKDRNPETLKDWVAQLCSTARYAEHMASTWLDLARFADTFGYQADWESRLWPWRDWLIRAFQQNMPYDQFVRELIAGDLLPGATRDQKLATAFLRLHRMTNEGGSIDAEFRQEYVADRVATVGTALLGLTVECARCHDHKYDPIPQEDYYSLCAFLGAIDEAGSYPNTTGATPRPALRLPTPEEAAREQAATQALEQTAAAYQNELLAAKARFPAWLATEPSLTLRPALRHEPLAGSIPGPRGNATALDGDQGPRIEGLPNFQRSDAYSLALSLYCPDEKSRATVLHTSSFTIEADQQGYQVLLEAGYLSWQVIHFWPGSAIAIRTRAKLPLQRWVDLVVTYDGSSRASGLAIFLDGERAPCEVLRDHLDGPATARTLELGFRSRDLGLKGGAMADLRVYERELSALEVRELHRPGSLLEARQMAEHELLRDFYLASCDEQLALAREQLRAARAAEHAALECQREIMVMEQSPWPQATYVLRRGSYADPDHTRPVYADRALSGIFAYDINLPHNRLGLAQWLTDVANPLLARVAVNRLWAQCFGLGLVATQENFGLQGESPSHPALLDALAVDFVESGFDVRALLMRILNSATFRQSSAGTHELQANDPDNRWLARGPSFRLSAEALRDQALHAAGLLSERVGGPSVKPWQPAGLWEDAGANAQGTAGYVADTGEAAHRRSLYTYRKRTAPPPNLLIFDAESREQCLARRQSTSTPLQNLVLWNDPVFFECAQALARRAEAEAGPDTSEQLAAIFGWLSSRPPTPSELGELRKLQQLAQAAYAANEDACRAVLGAERAEPALAALTIAASTLLATDAFLHCR